jgi:hypothetical protein
MQVRRNIDALARCLPPRGDGAMPSIGGPAFRGAGVSPREPDHPAGRSASDRLLQSSPLAARLADRARVKVRDENVRFKQSMNPHVSREGQLVPLETGGKWKCKQTYSQSGWLCLWVWELWRSSPRGGCRAPSDHARPLGDRVTAAFEDVCNRAFRA